MPVRLRPAAGSVTIKTVGLLLSVKGLVLPGRPLSFSASAFSIENNAGFIAPAGG